VKRIERFAGDDATESTFAPKFAGTFERFTGDGLLVLFNDPLPCPDPCLTAARLAMEMRAGVHALVDVGISAAATSV